MNVCLLKDRNSNFFMFKMYKNLVYINIYRDIKLNRLERKRILSIISSPSSDGTQLLNSDALFPPYM